MSPYAQQLKRELARRDAALEKLAGCGDASAAILKEKFADAGKGLRAEMISMRVFVGEQLNLTGDVMNANIQRTGAALGTQIDNLKASLNPANTIRDHPWGTTIGATLAGALSVPVVKSLITRPATNGEANVVQTPGVPQSRVKSVLNTILENAPSMIIAFLKHRNPDSKTDQPAR